jgi:Phage minor capsid protein 2
VAVNVAVVDQVAVAVAAIYREGELALIAAITRRLAQGLDATDWQVRKLNEVHAVRWAAQAVVQRLRTDADPVLRRGIADAYRAGNAAAVIDLNAALDPPVDPRALAADLRAGNAVQALADAAVAELRPVQQAVLPAAESAYRQAVAGATARRLTGVTDTRHAAQAAWAGLVDRGITGFTDRTGRRWQLSTYVEMAVRTSVHRAQVVGVTDVAQAAGTSQVYVVNSPRECPLCRPWESKVLSLVEPVEEPAVATLAAAQAAGLHHPNCFPGEVLVSAPTGVRASDARRYEGELIVVHTAGGEELPVTPNHPVLTPEGWVAAGALQVGDRVLRYRGGDQRMEPALSGLGPDDQLVPARIGDVHQALLEASPVPPVRMPAAPEQFHGDGSDGEVEVVLADRLLADGVLTEVREGVHDGPLVVGRPGLGALPAPGPAFQFLAGAHRAADRVMGGGSQGGPLCRGHAPQASGHRLAAADGGLEVLQGTADLGLGDAEPFADLGLGQLTGAVQLDGLVSPVVTALTLPGHVRGGEPTQDDLPADADAGRDLVRRLAGLVAADHVIDIERRHFAGHVYNLQTGGGWYVAGGIVVHNCRHAIRPYVSGRSRIAPATPNPALYAAEQRQRAIERRLRGWRARHAAALTDDARQFAATRVAAWAQHLTDHLQAHSELPRKSYREVPGAGFVPPPSRRSDLAELPGA